MKLRVRAKAERDLAEAFAFYEAQEPGVGLDFLRCIDAAMAGIQRHPLANPIFEEEIRRSLVRRFPYGIYFVVEENAVVILSIIHLARGTEAVEDSLD